MIPRELFQKVRRIEITTSRLVSDVFAGQYHSVFKGQGIEFDEVREYQFGDDIRTIDWNVTARTGRPHIKKFVEERELTVMLLVDVSRSCRFASVNELKSQLAAEISALLALSATRNNDKVGLIMFSDRIELFIPPRKGSRHILRVIREILYFQPQGRQTNIVQALEYLNKVTARQSIAFLVSDLMVPADQIFPSNRDSALRKTLAASKRRHDLSVISLNDPFEESIPSSGLLRLEDLETGEELWLDASDSHVREEYARMGEERARNRTRLFQSIGIDHIAVSTAGNYADELVKFFIKRQRKIRSD